MQISPKLIALLLSTAFCGTAMAQKCTARDVKPQDVQAGMKATSRLESLLNQTDAKVLVIAREGQDLRKYGIVFSHAAFAVRAPGTNQWAVYHELNGCPKDKSGLFREGLGMFFLDDPTSYQAAMVVPDPAIQDRLYRILTGPKLPMHQERYSLVAYPFSVKRQNSNGWPLEVFAMAAADYPIYTRSDAQEWLVKQDYKPGTIRVSGAKQLFATLFVPNATVQDHPKEDAASGTLKFNSGDSLLRFVSRYRDTGFKCPGAQYDTGICMIRD